MRTLRTVVSARTSFANTPESDQLARVMHDVTVSLAESTVEVVRISATDPGEAIDIVGRIPSAEYLALPRIPDVDAEPNPTPGM